MGRLEKPARILEAPRTGAVWQHFTPRAEGMKPRESLWPSVVPLSRSKAGSGVVIPHTGP